MTGNDHRRRPGAGGADAGRKLFAAMVAVGSLAVVLALLYPLLKPHLPLEARATRAGATVGAAPEAVAGDADARAARPAGSDARTGPGAHELVVAGELDALREPGPDRSTVNDVVGGMTPVMTAASMGRADLIEQLIRLGADPNKPGGAGRTALQYAAENNRIAAARALLDAGADVNGHDGSRLTPLIMAADRGYRELALLFIERGADTNIVMRAGWTALLDAARNGDAVLARALIAAGADPRATINGWTAAALARDRGHVALASYLESL